MIKKYILNFWIWWYGVQLRSNLQAIYSFWSLSLANLNILPMLANLFVPMYQDQSFIGKFLSLFLRLGWVFFGSIFLLVITIPLIVIFFAWLILPILCIFEIINFFV